VPNTEPLFTGSMRRFGSAFRLGPFALKSPDPISTESSTPTQALPTATASDHRPDDWKDKSWNDMANCLLDLWRYFGASRSCTRGIDAAVCNWNTVTPIWNLSSNLCAFRGVFSARFWNVVTPTWTACASTCTFWGVTPILCWNAVTPQRSSIS